MDDGQAAQGPKPARRGVLTVLKALSQPRVAVMLALGFGSGLPFMLIGNTFGYWLADEGVKLAVIGFLSWVGLAYLVKFLWGAMVDRLRPPLLTRLGRRRGWMLVAQIGVALGLIGMAACSPKTQIGLLSAFAVFTGVAAAVQDTVIDAWRIEIARDADELGLLTSAYSLGYRIALIGTEAVILLIAQALGWPLAYALYGGAMVAGVVAALCAEEPKAADMAMEAHSQEQGRHPLAGLFDAVVGPFIAFFRAHGLAMALLMLAMITFYHLCDYMRGPMSNPYYKALGISKETVAGVRLTLGLAGSLIGIAAGGLSSVRFGARPTLILGAILQPIGIAAFALLGWHGGDYVLTTIGPLKITAFETLMTFDAFAIGYSGVALVSYMSTLTSLGYTATQYALLTSALAWTGKSLKGFSGALVEGLQHGRTLLDAYAQFYLLCGTFGAPAIVLCGVLAWRTVSLPPRGGKGRGWG
ncbi:MAG: MFS transporter [Caulobacteraceae bacterium]|nr:MFS transporter [Caulobacteraceae bacterium]